MVKEEKIKRSDYIIFLNEMEDKLRAYYDVARDFPVGDEVFDMYAEYKESVEDYFIMSMLKVYMYHVFAHILFKKFDNLDKNTVEYWFEWMKTEGKKHLLKIPQDHYLTVLALVAIAPEIDEEAAEVFKKTFLTKSITFRLRGSYDVAVLGFDWTHKKVYFPKGAEEIAHSVFPEYVKLENKRKRR